MNPTASQRKASEKRPEEPGPGRGEGVGGELREQQQVSSWGAWQASGGVGVAPPQVKGQQVPLCR